jgi:hypothetical protein
MDLTHFVYVALIVFALLVITYWVAYTTHLKTPRSAGKQEGIAMATQEHERHGQSRPHLLTPASRGLATPSFTATGSSQCTPPCISLLT